MVRGGLNPKAKPKAKEQVKKQTKLVYKILRYNSKFIRKTEKKLQWLKGINREANSKAKLKQYYSTLAKTILPVTIKEYETHIEFDHKDLARTFILGKTAGGLPAYPPDFSSTSLSGVTALGGKKNKKVILSCKFAKKSSFITETEAEKVWREFNIEEEKDRLHNPNGYVNLSLQNKKEALVQFFHKLYNKAENQFWTQGMVTIRGEEEEVLNGESDLINELSSNRISFKPADDLQFAAFTAATPIPKMDNRFIVEAPSEIAAKLATMTAVNPKYDKTGMIFGKHEYTLADVIIDLRKLAARHLVMFGATGSGKTFTTMLLLMRMKSLLGYRVIYITRKMPDRIKGAVTDYEAVTKFWGDEGINVEFGGKNFYINPLQILYDKANMREDAAEIVWNKSRAGTTAFFKSLCDNEWSANFESVLEDALEITLEEKKIYRDKVKSWDRKPPTITDLKTRWKNRVKDKTESWEDRRACIAMLRKTKPISPGGSMDFLLGAPEGTENEGRTNLDMSKNWITINLAHADPRIQNALYIWITNALAVRFFGDPNKRTVCFVDEARAFLKDPTMVNSLLDKLTLGRSNGFDLWLGTQEPTDLVKSGYAEEWQTNAFMAVCLGRDLPEPAVKPVQKYFEFPDAIVQYLLTCKLPGQGVLKVGKDVIPVRFEAVPLEVEIIEGRYTAEKPEPISAYRLKPEFLKKGIDGMSFLEKHKVIFKTMLEENYDESALIADGYQKLNRVQKVTSAGSTIMYYPAGSIDLDTMHMTMPGIGDMTVDHYASVAQEQAFIMSEGYRVSGSHTGGADSIFEWIGEDGKVKVGALEHEIYGSHTKEDFLGENGKIKKLMAYDAYKIICSSDDYKKFINMGIPEKYLLQRGKDFPTWFNSVVKPQKQEEIKMEEIKPEEIPAQSPEPEEPEQKEPEPEEIADIKLTEEELNLADLILVTEEDLVGQAIFESQPEIVQRTAEKLDKIKQKKFKRQLARDYLKEEPVLGKALYKQACRVLGGNPETDLKLESEENEIGAT